MRLASMRPSLAGSWSTHAGAPENDALPNQPAQDPRNEREPDEDRGEPE